MVGLGGVLGEEGRGAEEEIMSRREEEGLLKGEVVLI